MESSVIVPLCNVESSAVASITKSPVPANVLPFTVVVPLAFTVAAKSTSKVRFSPRFIVSMPPACLVNLSALNVAMCTDGLSALS